MFKRFALLVFIVAAMNIAPAPAANAACIGRLGCGGDWGVDSVSCAVDGTQGTMTLTGGPAGGHLDLDWTTYDAKGNVVTDYALYDQVNTTSFTLTYAVTGSISVYDYVNDQLFTCSGAPSFAGYPIPKNKDGSLYEQKYIACTMSVFDAPGGNAINGASVKEGQVFYAGKDTKEDADGKSWTPIFVSSGTPVWIWSSCVK